MALFSRTLIRLILCVFLYEYIICFYTFYTSSCSPQCGEFFSANGVKSYSTVFVLLSFVCSICQPNCSTVTLQQPALHRSIVQARCSGLFIVVLQDGYASSSCAFFY